ncbi:hypothetical protein AB0L05_32340 [Nonomuraea pusilla]|uniref:WXG100-like domain-containing protein n=1 Tax=Nonomuraea pusilla TaxID=46177 RepID=UPI00332C1E7B
MWLDGDIPAWTKPWVGWVVGMDWPQAEESRLFALADALADAAYRVGAGVGVAVPDAGTWDGEALRAFVEHVSRRVGPRRADLLNRLAAMATSLNDLGVQVQYTKRMIRLSVAFLVFQLATLLPVILNPATTGVGLAAAGLRARFTRAVVAALAKRLLLNVGLFGGLMGGMDLYVQASQPRRDRIDWGQVLESFGTGALNGAFLTGATWLAPPRTLLGFTVTAGVAGGLTDAAVQALDDQPFDLGRLLKGVTSGAVGAADAHWASWNPHHAVRPAGADAPPPPRRALHSEGTRRPREAPVAATQGGRRAAPEQPRHRGPALQESGAGAGRRGPGPIESKLNWGQERPAGDPLRSSHRFAQAAAQGPVGGWEPAGLDSVRVTLADGSHAMLVDLPTPQERDAKTLVAQLGQELGLKMPSTHPVGGSRLLVEWVYGDPSGMSWSGPSWNLQGTAATRDGVLAGLLGALLRDEPVLLDALSGEAALMPDPGAAKAMSRLFVRDAGSGQEGWAPNPLSPGDAARVQRYLRAMRVEFAQAGFADAHARMTEAAREIAAHAVSTEPVFAADPDAPLPKVTTSWLDGRGDEIARLTAALADTAPPGAGRPLVDPAGRLAENAADPGRVADTRESDLGRVVTFRDGSQALALTGKAGADALEAWLARRALGLDGPAVHRAQDGTVYQAHGSDLLRVSLATGVRATDVIPLDGGAAEVVTFNDGAVAVRREFDSVGAADEFEARAHAAHALRDGVQGVHRAGPNVVYEHRVSPWHWADDERAVPATARPELDRRALHALLTRADLPRGVAGENPLLRRLDRGAAPLTEADAAALRSRYEALRPEFDGYGLGDRLRRHLELIGRTDPDAPLRLGPLRDPSPLTPDFREPPWRPPDPGVPPLAHLLEGGRLRQVNELAVGRGDDPALAAAAETHLDRADAELALRPVTSGHVTARVPADWLPADVRPGSQVVFHGLLEGVDDPARLADEPGTVRLTIRASGYTAVEDLSGRPGHALFGAGVRLKVLAIQESFGERHLLAVQVPLGRRPESVAAVVPRARPPLTPELRRHLRDHVERTPAGVWLRDLDHPHDRSLATSARNVRPVEGAYYVDGHGSELGNAIGDETLDARRTAALLLHSPGLRPDDVILLANCRIGTGRHPAMVARLTGHVVIASDSAVHVTEDGHMSAVSAEDGHLGGRGHLRVYLPDDPVPGHVMRGVAGWTSGP